MNLSPKQEKSLEMAKDFLLGPDQVFKLFGHAGTGKTTIAKLIASMATELMGGSVKFAAFTGKAAYVLQQAGCPEACTIHSLIYLPKEKSQKRLQKYLEARAQIEAMDPVPTERLENADKIIAQERANLRRPMFTLNTESPLKDCSLLIVDECSMLDKLMGEDLLSFETKILVLGDPNQLPPIKGAGFFTSGSPDMLLTEIHRQAEGNPIIDMSTRIREGDPLPYGDYGTSKVIESGTLDPQEAKEADQVIVGTNAMRRKVNQRIRELRGFGGEPIPQVGERLVCLKNNGEKGLLNGAIYIVDQILDDTSELLQMIVLDEGSKAPIEISAHRNPFKGEDTPYWELKESDQFDFGYALTCHKSQGSQWENVIVFDESSVFAQHRRKWLYTAVTRASDRVTVVR